MNIQRSNRLSDKRETLARDDDDDSEKTSLQIRQLDAPSLRSAFLSRGEESLHLSPRRVFAGRWRRRGRWKIRIPVARKRLVAICQTIVNDPNKLTVAALAIAGVHFVARAR